MEVINHPRHRSICYHPSLLPRHRGASAISWWVLLTSITMCLRFYRKFFRRRKSIFMHNNLEQDIFKSWIVHDADIFIEIISVRIFAVTVNSLVICLFYDLDRANRDEVSRLRYYDSRYRCGAPQQPVRRGFRAPDCEAKLLSRWKRADDNDNDNKRSRARHMIPSTNYAYLHAAAYRARFILYFWPMNRYRRIAHFRRVILTANLSRLMCRLGTRFFDTSCENDIFLQSTTIASATFLFYYILVIKIILLDNN